MEKKQLSTLLTTIGQFFGLGPSTPPMHPEFICSEDFCEACGECLACEGDLPCADTDDHQHIIPEAVNHRTHGKYD
jgi:hypothetical protein